MKILLIIFSLFLCCTLFIHTSWISHAEENNNPESYRSETSPIYLSEIMVNPDTGAPEWVELYNHGTQTAHLEDWYIDDIQNGGSSPKKFSLEIAPQGYAFVDLSSALFNNGGDEVHLLDNTQKEIERLVYTESEKNKTWARGTIQNNIFCIQEQSKGEKNMVCEESSPTPTRTQTPSPSSSLSPTPTPSLYITPTQTLTPTTQPDIVSPEDIFISEVMVAPESGNKEWIEIYNADEKTAILEDWYIDDEENAGSAPKKFSAEIPGKGYYFYVLSTGIFNNGGDHVRLMTENEQEIERFIYESSEKGYTWGRNSFDTDTFCLQEASPGIENTSCFETIPGEEDDQTDEIEEEEENTDTDVSKRLSYGSFSDTSSQGTENTDTKNSQGTVKSSVSVRSKQTNPTSYQDTIPKGEFHNDHTNNTDTDTNHTEKHHTLENNKPSSFIQIIMQRGFSFLSAILACSFAGGMYFREKN